VKTGGKRITIAAVIGAIVLGAVLFAFLGSPVVPKIEGERVYKIKYHLQKIIDAAEIHRVASGAYPENIVDFTDEPGFTGDPTLRLLEPNLRDPWGHHYDYRIIAGKPHVFCYGKDGVPGGTGDNQDFEWPEPEGR
jgi:hypothetical protein